MTKIIIGKCCLCGEDVEAGKGKFVDDGKGHKKVKHIKCKTNDAKRKSS